LTSLLAQELSLNSISVADYPGNEIPTLNQEHRPIPLKSAGLEAD